METNNAVAKPPPPRKKKVTVRSCLSDLLSKAFLVPVVTFLALIEHDSLWWQFLLLWVAICSARDVVGTLVHLGHVLRHGSFELPEAVPVISSTASSRRLGRGTAWVLTVLVALWTLGFYLQARTQAIDMWDSALPYHAHPFWPFLFLVGVTGTLWWLTGACWRQLRGVHASLRETVPVATLTESASVSEEPCAAVSPPSSPRHWWTDSGTRAEIAEASENQPLGLR